MNNPLKYSDPSGESLVGAIIIGAVIGTFTSGMSAVANGGDVGEATLRGAFWGAVGGAVSFGIGSIGQGLIKSGMAKGLAIMLKSAMHATSQGLMNTIQGGDFGTAFRSGFIGAITGSLTAGTPRLFRIISSGMVSGMLREAQGGSFVKGFTVSVITTICNDVMHENEAESAKEKKEEMSPAMKEQIRATMKVVNDFTGRMNGYASVLSGKSSSIVEKYSYNRSRQFYGVNQLRKGLAEYGIKLINNNKLVADRIVRYVGKFARRVNIIAGITVVANVVITRQIMPSDTLNAAVTAVGILGGPIGTAAACVYFGADLIVGKFTGQSIGGHLDDLFHNKALVEDVFAWW